MMKYYYCNEDDRVLSREDLRLEFESFQSEGGYEGETFSDYLEGCMWWNNGALTPLLNHVDNLKQKLARVRSYGDPDNDDWICSLSAQIAEYNKLYLEV